MTVIPSRVGPPPPAPATAATPLTRRPSGDARPSDASPEHDAARRSGSPGDRFSAGIPDPSGRSGGLIDVFA